MSASATRLVALVLVLAPGFRFAVHAQTSSQFPSSSGISQSSDSESRAGVISSDDTADSSDASSQRSAGVNPADSMPQAPLSADEIVNILQQNPDLVMEMKSLMADRLQEQGMPIDASTVSDETLYSQIAANASLRASIRTFLRARGYVSGDELRSAGPEVPGEPSTAVDLTSGQRLPQQSARNSTRENAAAAEMELQRTAAERGPRALAASPAESAGIRRSSSAAAHPRNTPGNASTDLPQVIRQRPPYDLRSLRDLYTQIPEPSARLTRFGSEVFTESTGDAPARGISGPSTPLDVPLGPDYVLGSGDALQIDLWGSVTQSVARVIDRDGRIFLPEAGSVSVAGLPLSRAQSVIETVLKPQYHNAQVSVTVSHLRSVRIYVVGDVQRPCGYDISSLATPLSALYAAGGPTSTGSLRFLRHLRGQQLVEDVDLYDLLLHGVRAPAVHFESGDTLQIPPVGPQVAVSGAVRRPAIYELKAGETMLATVIEDAGGFTPAASLGHIVIERIDPNQQRETVTLSNSGDTIQAGRDAVASFQVRDGDRIRVEPVLPYSQRAIYLEGHVVRPGRMAYTDGMRLSDVLHSYRDMLPEPAAHGEIVRLVAPDLHAETVDFNVPDVLIGNANVDLQPFDTVRIFGRYQIDAPQVTIRGEVLRPGIYPMSKGMTTAQLVHMAGGFKRDALQNTADLTSYTINSAGRVVASLATVPIGAAIAGTDPHADVALKPGDILTVHQVTSWSDIGQSIRIQGEVRYPGSYGFQEGELLSSVLRRAGGFLPTAYPAGALLIRDQVREVEQRSREELIRQIETNSASARLSPSLAGGNAGSALQLIKAQQDQVLADLKSHPPVGRMVIQISPDIDHWANTSADIKLRRGDVLTIPKRPGFVLVTGQVYNATALTFTPDKTATWYLSRAGGTNATANRKEIFIIRENGSVVGRRSGGWFDGDVLSTKLNPGDVIVVPQKIIGASVFWRNLLTTGQLAASVAITAGVASAAL